MGKTPAYYIFLGLLIGATFGLAIEAASGNIIRGVQFGALAGTFIGWLTLRRDDIQTRLHLPRSREIAQVRLQRMETCLQWLNEESFGVL